MVPAEYAKYRAMIQAAREERERHELAQAEIFATWAAGALMAVSAAAIAGAWVWLVSFA